MNPHFLGRCWILLLRLRQLPLFQNPFQFIIIFRIAQHFVDKEQRNQRKKTNAVFYYAVYDNPNHTTNNQRAHNGS